MAIKKKVIDVIIVALYLKVPSNLHETKRKYKMYLNNQEKFNKV